MEKHTCKLCFRRFSNGRALGGHMRSHVSSAAATTKQPPPPPAPHPVALMLLEDHQQPSLYSPSSSSSSGPEDAAAEVPVGQGGPSAGGGGVSYGLRENPRKSYRVVDPEFSSVVDYAFFFGAGSGTGNGNSSSVVVQDRESETESSRAPSSSRRRSKRRRRYSPPRLRPTSDDNGSKHPAADAEPVSSVSDTTPDEDVALCLMMLSRDVWTWKDQHRRRLEQEEDEYEEEEEEQAYVAEEEEDHHQSESEEERRMTGTGGNRSRKGGRSRYQCGTCRKVFRSYQALGGHRASHKKAKPCAVAAPLPPLAPATEGENDSYHHQIHDGEFEANGRDPRVHECPFCFRVFSSGQALGGHKRSHFVSAAPSPRRPNAVTTAIVASTFAAPAGASNTPVIPATSNASGGAKVGDSFIDLNLPAPMEFEDGSHVELSDVSVAEQELQRVGVRSSKLPN